MQNKLVNGDYVPDGAGGFVRLEGAADLLAQALFRLSCRRGSFPFLPDLGSRLYALGREKPSARAAVAQQYAVEALAGLAVTVDAVTVTAEDDALAVTIQLTADGNAETLEVWI